jgi:hypothetical protein
VLFLAENLLFLVQPWLLGMAVQGLTQARFRPAALFLAQIVAMALVGGTRRSYDGWFFAKIYAEMAGRWAVEQRTKGRELAAVSARAVLARQLVDFLQRDLPLVVHVLFQFVGAAVLIFLNEPCLLLGCGVLTCVTLARCPWFVRQTAHWNQQLHDQLEKEVDVLDAGEEGAVATHYANLARFQVRLAALQASQFAWSQGLTAFLIGFMFWYQRGGTLHVSQVIALLGYLQMFGAGLTNLFPWLQQCLRLRDVVRRLRE